jgi:hypothetical protein
MGVTRFVLAAVTILVAAMSYSALKPHSESDLLSDWSGEPPPWPVFIGVNVAASLLRKAADALTPPPIQMADLANGYHKTVLAFMLQKVRSDLHSLRFPRAKPESHLPRTMHRSSRYLTWLRLGRRVRPRSPRLRKPATSITWSACCTHVPRMACFSSDRRLLTVPRAS